MINNNKNTTILITSIMLTAVLLLPSSAFGEIPDGCDVGTGTIGAIISLDPPTKVNDSTPVDVIFKVTNLQDDDVLPACDVELEGAEITLNAVSQNDGTAHCEVDDAQFPILIQNNEEIILWGPAGIFGQCELTGMSLGSNAITGEAQGKQFNIADTNEIQSDVAVLIGTSSLVYDACINVMKEGPEKVRLDDGEALVTYTVWIVNCAE